jgi:hypothetical protein
MKRKSSWLSRLLGAKTRPVERVEHPLFGSLQYDDEVDAWRGTAPSTAGPLTFLIGGGARPDDVLLERAGHLVQTALEFTASVRSFLDAEAQDQPRWAAEISALTLEEICLLWPHRPDEGMLYFHGPDQYRVWHAGYHHGQPRDLGFDS